ncbi:hypothetical protein, partial [Enterobacter hormaechei]|uniref:hypothetical protein n=1 Tax=Enterobacter hormaechei TaxID=158836 RepID=UPI0022EC7851
QARLASAPWTPAPAPFPTRAIAAAWVSGAILIAAAVWWPPMTSRADAQTPTASRSTAVDGTPVLQSQALRIDAPAYTGQVVRTQTE